MSLYSQRFDPFKSSVAEQKIKGKKRKYTASRSVTKNVVFLSAACVNPDRSISVPSSQSMRKLTEEGFVNAILCNRSWDSLQVHRNIVALTPPREDVILLKPIQDGDQMRCMSVMKDCNMDKLLSLFPRKYIYVLQVDYWYTFLISVVLVCSMIHFLISMLRKLERISVEQ